MRRPLVLLLLASALGAEAPRPRVVAFWATWCSVCRAELKWLEEVHRSGAAHVETYVMDQRGWQTVTPFLRQHGYKLPVKLATRAVFRRYGLKGGPPVLPRTLVFDVRGRLLKDCDEALDRETWQELTAAVE